MKSTELVNLILSPQWVSKLLQYFLIGAKKVSTNGIKTELIYLALPLIINDESRQKLLKTNINGTMKSVFQDKQSLELQNLFLKLNNQVNEYRLYTNRGLIFLSNVSDLTISEHVYINSSANYKKENLSQINYCRAAYYLGVIFGKEDYRNLFIKLGVTNI